MLLPASEEGGHTQLRRKRNGFWGCTSGSVVVREVSALQHELWNHAVEDAALVTVALLSCAQRTKVLGSARNVGEELEGDALGGSFADLDIEENFL